jgi:hypothetical protein
MEDSGKSGVRLPMFAKERWRGWAEAPIAQRAASAICGVGIAGPACANGSSELTEFYGEKALAGRHEDAFCQLF